MYKLTFALFLAILSFTACKQDSGDKAATTTEQANTTNLAGHWIAMDFCSRADQFGSVLNAMNNAHKPYSYSLTFNPDKPDSVFCYNGFETWALPVVIDADTIEMKNAGQNNKSVFLIYNSTDDKSITMFDGTSGSTHMDKFIKSKAGAQTGPLSFNVALNHNLFNGTFTRVGGKSDEKIQLTPGGVVMNLEPYKRYEVCTGGDCFMTLEPIDVITLASAVNGEVKRTYMGFKYSAQNDTLRFYNLVNTNPEEKGAYAIGKPAYTLIRKRLQ
jgi:hypothetical protein